MALRTTLLLGGEIFGWGATYGFSLQYIPVIPVAHPPEIAYHGLQRGHPNRIQYGSEYPLSDANTIFPK